MSLIRDRPAKSGYLQVVGATDSDLKYLNFSLVALHDGERWESRFVDQEAVLVILSGKCDIASEDRQWKKVGQRESVFDGLPTSLYLPPGRSCRVQARGKLELAVCLAHAQQSAEVALIPPEQVGVRQVGHGNFQRIIYDIAVAEGTAQRLLVGETFNGPGLWSSYPPHKHDVGKPPEEVKLEEIYHYRLNPAGGFGLQRIYGEGFDECYVVQDRDTITIPRGYHPVVAAPGYQLYYLWMLAGETRLMRPNEDKAHAWVGTM